LIRSHHPVLPETFDSVTDTWSLSLVVLKKEF
jgi:hypothetical protein